MSILNPDDFLIYQPLQILRIRKHPLPVVVSCQWGGSIGFRLDHVVIVFRLFTFFPSLVQLRKGEMLEKECMVWGLGNEFQVVELGLGVGWPSGKWVCSHFFGLRLGDCLSGENLLVS